ncbi:MAG: thiamine pyrophosphate-binding protein [Promethearchaeota archaeon]
MNGPKEMYTGSEVIIKYLLKEGVPYVVGIPGHGNLAIMDAIARDNDKIKFIQVKQEMSGVHLAEAFYRVSGTPLPVITSIGPGAANTVIGAANAFVDSKPVMIITGDTHVHMRGKGVLQEIERRKDSTLASIFSPVVKRSWNVARVEQIPTVMHRAFNYMLSGRKGPVHVNLPFDVQSDSISCEIPAPGRRKVTGTIMYPDPGDVSKAARILMAAKRPVILIGGGVIESGGFDELKVMAEMIGAAVINTMMGLSAFPADHDLYAWCGGSKGTDVGNILARSADVILALGTRFADETTSSYKDGVTFSIPPTKLIHVDIDVNEIGKNYPVEVGIAGDIKVTLKLLSDEMRAAGFKKIYKDTPYFREIQERRQAWFGKLDEFIDDSRDPVMISTILREVRAVIARDAYVVTSSGNVQAQIIQEFPFYIPGTCITAGGFSTMGFSLPAAIGAKLAAPDRQVVALVGDGDFMMTIAELSTAVQYKANILVVVINNMSWMAIKDLQMAAYGKDRAFGTDFTDVDGNLYSADFARIAAAFGCHGERISRKEEIAPALLRAMNSGKPAVVEILTSREFPFSGSPAVGWWDVPIPAYMKSRREKYEKERQGERL